MIRRSMPRRSPNTLPWPRKPAATPTAGPRRLPRKRIRTGARNCRPGPRPMAANAQSEKDIAESLRTGTMVHTRTDWDEQQHQAIVSNIKGELAVFDAENKLLANIRRWPTWSPERMGWRCASKCRTTSPMRSIRRMR